MLCTCGCGRETDLAKYNRKDRGYIKGQSLRYVKGHPKLKPIPLAERFWRHVDRHGPDECWPWIACRDKAGHGQIMINRHPVHADLVAYELINGPIPLGFFLLHHCNNSFCCNPTHIYTKNIPRDISLPEVFWDNIIIGSPDECWEWQGRKHTSGYGVFSSHGHETFAHRTAYELTYGPIPLGKIICHRCNNPPCCNPTHIYAGTFSDNTHDLMRTNRYSPPPHQKRQK